ncbi:hypothetical protein Dimus_011286 [Dionaea muscipula]
MGVMMDRQEDLYGPTALGWRWEVEVDEEDAEEVLREKESTSGGGSNVYAFLDNLKLLFLIPPSMYMLFWLHFVPNTTWKMRNLKGNLPVASPSITDQQRVLVENNEEDDESLITIICS